MKPPRSKRVLFVSMKKDRNLEIQTGYDMKDGKQFPNATINFQEAEEFCYFPISIASTR